MARKRLDISPPVKTWESQCSVRCSVFSVQFSFLLPFRTRERFVGCGYTVSITGNELIQRETAFCDFIFFDTDNIFDFSRCDKWCHLWYIQGSNWIFYCLFTKPTILTTWWPPCQKVKTQMSGLKDTSEKSGESQKIYFLISWDIWKLAYMVYKCCFQGFDFLIFYAPWAYWDIFTPNNGLSPSIYTAIYSALNIIFPYGSEIYGDNHKPSIKT